MYFVFERGYQSQGREGRASDRETFSGRRRGVSEGVSCADDLAEAVISKPGCSTQGILDLNQVVSDIIGITRRASLGICSRQEIAMVIVGERAGKAQPGYLRYRPHPSGSTGTIGKCLLRYHPIRIHIVTLARGGYSGWVRSGHAAISHVVFQQAGIVFLDTTYWLVGTATSAFGLVSVNIAYVRFVNLLTG